LSTTASIVNTTNTAQIDFLSPWSGEPGTEPWWRIEARRNHRYGNPTRLADQDAAMRDQMRYAD
jgi:hypothetical protein